MNKKKTKTISFRSDEEKTFATRKEEEPIGELIANESRTLFLKNFKTVLVFPTRIISLISLVRIIILRVTSVVKTKRSKRLRPIVRGARKRGKMYIYIYL